MMSEYLFWGLAAILCSLMVFVIESSLPETQRKLKICIRLSIPLIALLCYGILGADSYIFSNAENPIPKSVLESVHALETKIAENHQPQLEDFFVLSSFYKSTKNFDQALTILEKGQGYFPNEIDLRLDYLEILILQNQGAINDHMYQELLRLYETNTAKQNLKLLYFTALGAAQNAQLEFSLNLFKTIILNSDALDPWVPDTVSQIRSLCTQLNLDFQKEIPKPKSMGPA